MKNVIPLITYKNDSVSIDIAKTITKRYISLLLIKIAGKNKTILIIIKPNMPKSKKFVKY